MLPNTPKNRAKLEILEMDEGRCRNHLRDNNGDLLCKTPRYMLSVHRIIRGGVPYTPDVCITLCAVCHNHSEGKGNPKDRDGNDTTGDRYLLTILEYWKDKIEDRWPRMRKHLKDKIERLELFR